MIIKTPFKTINTINRWFHDEVLEQVLAIACIVVMILFIVIRLFRAFDLGKIAGQ